MDRLTTQRRSWLMSRVKSANTKPELAVRKMLHALGYRYRLHRKDLPGKPDIVFVSRKKAVFVHGCFWHGHNCGKARIPKSRSDFWAAKMAANRKRDANNAKRLKALGWRSLVVWQCQQKDALALEKRIVDFLE